MKIAVLFGGISTERNVSIAGGKSVIEALRQLGHEVVAVDPAFGVDKERRAESMLTDVEAYPSLEELAQFNSRSIIDCINSELFDDVEVAFLVLHGKYGEDGLIQALLEMRGIPYTGSGVKANAVAIDKAATKTLLNADGILTPQWLIVDKSDADNFDLIKDIRKGLGAKVVIKPNDQGSTIGITMVLDGNLDEIANGIREAAKYSDVIVVERFIEGRELTVGIVGDEVLPVIEIVAEGGFYDYKRKYSKGHTEYICPAEITNDVAEFTQNMAVMAHQALGCYGLSRIDFRLDEDNQPYCLEVNTIPGFTSTSLVPKAAKLLGYEFPELCQKLIDLALANNKSK